MQLSLGAALAPAAAAADQAQSQLNTIELAGTWDGPASEKAAAMLMEVKASLSHTQTQICEAQRAIHYAEIAISEAVWRNV